MNPADAKAARPGGSRIAVLVATVLGIGYAPIAPGTWGTAAAVPLVWVSAGLPQWGYLALCLAVTGIAVAAAGAADRAFADHDSSRIVVDEVAGYFWTLLPAPDRADPALLLPASCSFASPTS